MSDLLAGLTELLRQESALVEELIAVGQEQSRALVANEIQPLAALLQEQENLTEQLGELEGERLKLQGELEAREGSGRRGIDELANIAGPESEVAAISNRLKVNFINLKELNELNGMLIRQGLHHVNRMQKLLLSASSITYSPSGGLDEKTGVKLLDKTV